MTLFSIRPVKGESFRVGDELLVVDLFPPNVRLVQFRRANVFGETRNRYCIVGYSENDCAECVRRDRARRVVVRRVWQISGCAEAVAVEYLNAEEQTP